MQHTQTKYNTGIYTHTHCRFFLLNDGTMIYYYMQCFDVTIGLQSIHSTDCSATYMGALYFAWNCITGALGYKHDDVSLYAEQMRTRNFQTEYYLHGVCVYMRWMQTYEKRFSHWPKFSMPLTSAMLLV